MFNTKKLWGLLLMTCFIASSFAEGSIANYQVIPLPLKIENGQGKSFSLNNSTVINYPVKNVKMKKNAEFLADYIFEETGKKLRVVSGAKPAHAIILKMDATITNKEGYQLTVNQSSITIAGATEAGVFYGIQTLRKSIPLTKTTAEITFPPIRISDAPRFGYRGMHLDICRHFFPVSFVKKYIDILALHNVNTFHWHLTDDQGWRIEIKKYPKLTTISSKRDETVIGHNTDKYDGVSHEGFYTQAQIKDIVKYAQDRYITIIPEIDMPGHMQAALAAYPEFGCTGGPYKTATKWGIFEDVLCAGNEKTFSFIEDVLTEVMQLFPSKYIHIGGDECPKTSWKKCPKCQTRIQAEGLIADEKHTAENRLQSYLISRVEKFVNSKGRRIIGWDEILEGGLAPNATVMSWRGITGGVEAAKQNHDVIMTPSTHLYFDHYQSDNKAKEPDAIGGFSPVEKVYAYEPYPAELTPEQQKHILGAQANLWTEYIVSEKQLEYMILPRLAALCEVQWTQSEKKNYQDFLLRIPRLAAIYKMKDYNFAKHIFETKAPSEPTQK